MDIHLEHLTPEQVEMCDIMWSFETVEEYFNWFECLDDDDQRQAETLQRLIILEALEEMLFDNQAQYQDVRNYLKKFML